MNISVFELWCYNTKTYPTSKTQLPQVLYVPLETQGTSPFKSQPSSLVVIKTKWKFLPV